MKKIIIISLINLIFFDSLAQKPLVDSSVYDKWHRPFGNVELSPDGSIAIFLEDGDSLCMLTSGSFHKEFVLGVSSFKMSKGWLAYRLKNAHSELVLRNLSTGNQRFFIGVSDYQFNAIGSALLLQRQTEDTETSLDWVELSTWADTTFWKGIKPDNFAFSCDGTEIAFTSENNKEARNNKMIWYYKARELQAQLIVPVNSDALGKGLKINSIKCFNSSGNKIFFTVSETLEKNSSNSSLPSVDVYSYKDSKLQSEQLRTRQRPDYTFVYNFTVDKVIRMEYENESIISGVENNQNQDLLLEKYGDGDFNEWNWNKNAQIKSVFLISTVDGTRKLLFRATTQIEYHLSPCGKYVIYYDANQRSYFCYNLTSGKIKNITRDAYANWVSYDRKDFPMSAYLIEGIAGWLKGDSAVLLYSQNDIFQVDPDGKRPTLNLTNNYGVKHHIQFRLAWSPDQIHADINPSEPLLLKAFNRENKDYSFCKIIIGKQRDPQLSTPLHKKIDILLKAVDVEVYCVSIESAENPTNYFITSDFKAFKQLTDFTPEKTYNWLTTELITWTTPDGRQNQGILYRPENFDPKKRYPVIFQYYERQSDNLHSFIFPQYVGAEIDIPTFVSNGYLVFVPDIHYRIGYPGRSAYNSIVSAAHYLSRFGWIDSAKIGLVGHSFGGFETDYVITHNHTFAAACSGAGMTDFISAYGSIIGDGSCRQRQYELYRDRIGATLWQRPDLYIENSPVLMADKVTTPVLLIANHDDEDVPAAQGFEFFTGLRRLGKKAWLLQYDKEGHGLNKEIDRKDYSIRIRQFFDCYLKDMPPPKWMTEGIPARQKQKECGYELDYSGKIP